MFVPLFVIYFDCQKILRKGDNALKNFVQKYSGIIAAFALVITTVVANSACMFLTYQEKMPENAKALRKF